MRILHLNTFGNGSTGKIATGLIEEASLRGEDAVLVYARGNVSEKIVSKRIGTMKEIYLHGLLSRITDRQGFYSKKATKQLIEFIKSYKPDIIHLHNLHGYYINIKILFQFLINEEIPIVWTLHDCWSFTGHCANFESVKCEKWKKQCYRCIQKKVYPKSCFKDNSYINYIEKKDLFTNVEKLNIVVPSNWLKEIVNLSFLKSCETFTIHNGIDLKQFCLNKGEFRKKYNLESEFIILGVANKWEDRKNLNAFIELSRRLNKNFKIVIVGVSKKQSRQLPDSMIGIQRTENMQELVSIYSQADVLFNPTLDDNFPTVNLEAMACGTPVITYDTGGSGEMLNSDTGVVIKDNSIETVVQVIHKLKDNNFLSGDCIKQASLFSKEKMAEQYMSLYQQMLSANKACH